MSISRVVEVLFGVISLAACAWVVFHCRMVTRWLAEWEQRRMEALGFSKSALEWKTILYPTYVLLFVVFLAVAGAVCLSGQGQEAFDEIWGSTMKKSSIPR
ncbi:MAG: hypothetical protein V4671_17405 [Armatimonadota bacterium]